MKWIGRILLGLLFIVAVIVAINYYQYHQGIKKVKAELPGNSKIAKTANGPIEYMIQGDSKKYILLIHGTPGSYHTFMADELVNEGFSVISPSRPGYFRTPLSSGETIHDQANLYAALLDELQIDSVAIIGFSGGGPSALQFASRHADKCTGLVIMASSGRTFAEPDRPMMEDWVMSTEFGRWTAYTSLNAEFEEDESDEALSYLKSAFFPMDQTSIGEKNDFAQFTSNWTIDLVSVSCPTLIIHGTEDELIPHSEAIYLSEGIPQSTLITKEGQDHFTVVFFEFAENLGRAAEFLK